MKANAVLAVALLLTAMNCVAQDAVKADSTHYSVILENEHVCVLDIHYPPYAKGNKNGGPSVMGPPYLIHEGR